jgi:YegS/Rv2252/BmrU family lipid kinase
MAEPTICVVFNPASGKKQGHPDTEALLQRIQSDPRIVLRTAGSPDDLPKVVSDAVSEGFPMIVAAGGDGTIGSVTAGLVGTDAILGILPMGTFNFMARSLGIPENLDEALQVLFDGKEASIDVGEINGKVFLNNASIGAYAAVLDVREGVYRRWGRNRLAAYWSVVLAMLTIYRPLSMSVTVDGKTWQTRSPMAFVASSAYQLEHYDFEGADDIRKGRVALVLAPDSNRLQLLWRSFKILVGGVQRNEDYFLHVGKDILIETRRGNRLVARDGEKGVMKGPYRFTLRRDAVRVRVPATDPNHGGS